MGFRSTVVSSVVLALVLLPLSAAPSQAQSFDTLIRRLPDILIEQAIQPRPDEPIIYLEDVPPRPRVVIDDIAPDRCRRIQAALAELGHDVGTVDGQCGPRTRAAISAFQQRLGATPTGSLNEAQEQALIAQASPPAAPPPVQQPAQPSTQPAPPVQTAAAAASLAGRWEGSYICGQGSTSLVLTFEGERNGRFAGKFTFGPHPQNRSIPKGEFAITGAVAGGSAVTVTPGRWIDRPSGYNTVGLEGQFSADGTALSGTVSTSACSSFSVTRVAVEEQRIAEQPAQEPAPAPAPAPAPSPPATSPTPPRPVQSADLEIDCAALPATGQADCEYFRQKATAVYFDLASARSVTVAACRALDTAMDEKNLLECLAGGYALREDIPIQRALYAGGWKGLGPILESMPSCSALVTRIRSVAAGVTGGPVPGAWEADQSVCRQLATIAVSRQARPSWGLCAIGSDPALAYRECSATGTDLYMRTWITAISNCAGGGDAASLNTRFVQAAATAGRESAHFTCEQIATMAVADGVLTETAIAGIRQDVADEQAALAERERQRAEAEERQRQLAEERRLAEEAARAAEEQRIATERANNPLYAALQAPPEYDGVARKLEQGDSFNFTDTTLLFTGGVASELLENCRSSVPVGDRVELATFVGAATLQAAGGNDYSNPDIGAMVRDQAASMATFTAGALAARAMQCAGADMLLANLADIVQDNKRSSTGGTAQFVATCTPVHGQASCTCLAEVGRASYSNIYQMSYSREMVYGIIERNPMAAMVIPLSCGIMNY